MRSDASPRLVRDLPLPLERLEDVDAADLNLVSPGPIERLAEVREASAVRNPDLDHVAVLGMCHLRV